MLLGVPKRISGREIEGPIRSSWAALKGITRRKGASFYRGTTCSSVPVGTGSKLDGLDTKLEGTRS